MFPPWQLRNSYQASKKRNSACLPAIASLLTRAEVKLAILPAGLLWLPTWMMPLRNVPVVITTDLHKQWTCAGTRTGHAAVLCWAVLGRRGHAAFLWMPAKPKQGGGRG